MKHPSHNLPPSPPHPAVLQTIGGRHWPYAYLEYCQRKCGDPFTLYPLDMPPMVFMSHPDDVRAVLTGDPAALHPGAGGQVIEPLIGARSFMLLEEEDHVSGRKIVAPAFHRRMVKEQTEAMRAAVEQIVESWPAGSPVALQERIRHLTLVVILKVIFSDEPPVLPALHRSLMQMLGISDTLLLQGPRLRHLPGWRGRWKRFLKQRAEIDAAIRQLVSAREQSGTLGEHGDLLDRLLLAQTPEGSRLSEREIRDNLMSMILAGHETTTGELSWAILLLAHNPAVQQQLAEDIDAGSEEYLTATVHETLRHKPVFVFTIPREVASPVQIGAWTYPRGVQLAACTYLMHHNPDLYPNPHTFSPERFLGRAGQSRTWLPWGGGRKHCLGRHFAMLELTTILRHLITTRTITPASDRIERPRWRSAILVPAHGARVVLAERQRTGNFF